MISHNMTINHIPETAKPDTYIEIQDGKLYYPAPSFVISRDKYGNICSTFGMLSWDLSAYSRNVKETKEILFHTLDHYTNKALAIQTRWLVFILLYFHHGRNGNGLSVSTIVSRSNLLNRLSVYADENSLSMYDYFSNHSNFIKFTQTLPRSERRNWFGLVRFYHSLPFSTCGFECININKISTRLLEKPSQAYWGDQTEVIPERIYLASLDFFQERISDFVDHLGRLRELFYALSEDISYARSETQQRVYGHTAETFCPTFAEATLKYGLSIFFEKHCIRNVTQLSHYLSTIQFSCKNMIHAFSGMRDGECYSLQYNCLQTRKFKGRRTLRLIGYTTKLVDSKKETYWITSPEIELAIKAAQYICQLVACHTGHPAEDTHLFPCLSHLNFSIGNCRVSNSEIIVANLKNAVFNYIFEKDSRFIIIPEDLELLSRIDFIRNWSSDSRFNAGNVWPLASHQFRRSLAVYALSSKLVSLTSLKRQLQHISLAMTLYYLKGNLVELSLFGDSPDHFANEVKNSYAIVAGLDYLEDVLSEEKLYGVHGQFIEERIRSLGTKRILDSRYETIRRAKNGELHYHPTPMGGCTNPAPCTKVLHHPVTGCITGCPHGVLTERSLQRAYKAQLQLVSNLHPGHALNTELLELKTIEVYMQKKGLTHDDN